MALDDRTNSPLDEEEKNKVILDWEKEEVTEELIDVLAKSENTDFSNMDEDEFMKGINDVISGADKLKKGINIDEEIGEAKPTDSMTMEEIFGVTRLTEENFKKICIKAKMKPIMELFDSKRWTLDIWKTIEITYWGNYVDWIIARMDKSRRKKFLEKKEWVNVDLTEVVNQEDDIEATKELVWELDNILAKSGWKQSFLDKLAEKAEAVKWINFLMKKSGYLDSALKNKVDTLWDALDMLKNLKESYRYRTDSMRTALEDNKWDLETLAIEMKKVGTLYKMIRGVFHIRKTIYDDMMKRYESIYAELSETKKAEALTYQKEFYDEILQLVKLVSNIEEYQETLENLQISTITHIKILSSLYQTLLTSYPQVKSILAALLQQMDNAAKEHHAIDTEESIRWSLTAGMVLLRKATAKSAKKAEKLATGRVFEKATLKRENRKLREIETSFDKVRAELLKQKDTLSTAIASVDWITEEQVAKEVAKEETEVVMLD